MFFDTDFNVARSLLSLVLVYCRRFMYEWLVICLSFFGYLLQPESSFSKFHHPFCSFHLLLISIWFVVWWLYEFITKDQQDIYQITLFICFFKVRRCRFLVLHSDWVDVHIIIYYGLMKLDISFGWYLPLTPTVMTVLCHASETRMVKIVQVCIQCFIY